MTETLIAGAGRTIGLAWVDGRTRTPTVEDSRRFVIERPGWRG